MTDLMSGSSAGVGDKTRFQLVNAVPAALLGLFIATLVASGAYSRRAATPAGLVHAVSHDPGWAAFIGFAILVGGLVLRPFQIALVQILEGYWGDWVLARFFAAVSIEQHRRRVDTMTVVSDAEAPRPSNLSLHAAVRAAQHRRRVGRISGRAKHLLRAYPAGRGDVGAAGFDDRLMPTMLGNLLRNAEDTAGDRYGLDMPTVYERMYPSIAEGRLGPVISQNLDVIDTTSALCVMTAVATVASLPLIPRLDWWSYVPLATALLSVACYKGALRAARRHAKHLATAFDLHRFDLMTALHWKPAHDPQSEYELNRQLTEFLAHRIPLKEYGLLGRRAFTHQTPGSSNRTK
jgi:hypothetical protein